MYLSAQTVTDIGLFNRDGVVWIRPPREVDQMSDLPLLLSRWANFYLLVSSAAATLIGLLFVVVTLAATRKLENQALQIQQYLTPNIVYFASVLATSALLMIPNHTRYTAAFSIGCIAVTGLLYSARLLIGQRRASSYAKWGGLISYVVVPLCAYGLFLAGALLLLSYSQCGLLFVGVGMLSLLVLAIRNTYALTIDVVSGTSSS